MARVLVVYYSRTSTTRTLAKRLASLLGADLEEIVDATDRRGLRGWLRSGYEAGRRLLAPIASTRPIDDYDMVVVGSPVWMMSLSSPVRAFLRRNRGKIHNLACFCTRGGEGPHTVCAQMADAAWREPIAELTVRQADLHSARSSRAIDEFVARIERALPVPPPVVVPRTDDAAARSHN